jgi:hypothetical protein
VRAQVSDSDILNFSGEDSLASSKAGALAVTFANGEPTSLRIGWISRVCGLFEIGFHGAADEPSAERQEPSAAEQSGRIYRSVLIDTDACTIGDGENER